MILKLVQKKEEVPGVTTFVFEPDTEFTWQAGQLLHYTLPHGNPDDRGIERYFTISSPPYQGRVTITTRFYGEKSSSFKKALFALPIGSIVEADGLEGDFTVTDNAGPLLLIAGGIGITPYHSILLELNHKGIDINARLLYSNRDEHFVFKDELDALAQRHSRFSIHYIVDPDRIDESLIREVSPDLGGPTFYVSGPEPMVEAMEKMLLTMGIPDSHLKRDFFPGYSQV